MLRTALVTSATLVFATGAALAEGGNAAPPPPPVIVAQTGFEGLYAGLEFGLGLGGSINNTASPDGIPDFEDGSAFGVFVGYNWQRDSLVFGGDLRYLAFDGMTTDAGGGAIIEVDNVIDLRGRLGFDAGDTLFYGAVGYSLANATDAGGSFDMDGFNYGLGVEYNLNEDLFVGLDYTGREMDGTSGAANYESSLDTLTLRLGLRF
ncbi:MAG: outer membrane beta-barrel protein [Roseicyclus sp.]